MKKRILLLIPTLILVGCSSPAVNGTEKKEVNLQTTVDETNKDNTENNKVTETNNSDEDNKEVINIGLDDTYIENFKSKLDAEGFRNVKEDIKSDDTWESMSKYIKEFKGGNYVVLINKTSHLDKIRGLEKSAGYRGSKVIDTKYDDVTMFEINDHHFRNLVAYNEKIGNGIIFIVNGSEKFDAVNNGLDYGKKLLSDLLK